MGKKIWSRTKKKEEELIRKFSDDKVKEVNEKIEVINKEIKEEDDKLKNEG